MRWPRRRRDPRSLAGDDEEWWGDEDRSLLEIESDPEMLAAQADVDSEPLTPRSPPSDPYYLPY